MTKEEKIKEAYGNHWELVKDYVDNNGWVFDLTVVVINDIAFEFYKNDNLQRIPITKEWRPKSLSGIENNRGWIKIESEDDLPKEFGKYWVIDRDNSKMYQREFDKSTKGFFLEYSTHYQPIQKPEPPIY